MNRKHFYAIIVVVIILAAVAAVVILKSSAGSNIKLGQSAVGAYELQQLQATANNSTLANLVSVGSANNFPVKISGQPLIVNGKPVLVYIGADYCPYCAITRWGLILALMRFGNFTNLQYMLSSPTDVYPNTPTFTFYNSSYESSYINFTGTEYQTRTGAPLENLTPLETSIMAHFNGPPGGGFPFTDFGNLTVQDGAEASPGLINKYNWTQITTMLNDPQSPVSKAIVGSADVFTVQICEMTNNTPASVCGQPYLQNMKKFLSG